MRKIEGYELRRWLEIANPGDRGIYFSGMIAVEKGSSAVVRRNSTAVWRLSTTTSLHRSLYYTRVADKKGMGCVLLFQRRAERGFDYIVHVLRRPSKEQLDLAFYSAFD